MSKYAPELRTPVSLVTGITVLFSVVAPVIPVAASPFSKGPYLQFPAPGTASILWEGGTNGAATVRYGEGERLDRTVVASVPVQMRSLANTSDGTNPPVKKTFYLYTARLEDLRRGAVYSYSVEMEGVRSSPRQFRLLDAEAPQTRFIVYGDSRSNPTLHRAVARQFASYAPEFVLHTGDLVARGEDYNLWSREFFDPAGEVIDRLPLFPVIGNHEQNGTNFLGYFDLPGNELFYSFDAGPVHVLALDFRSQKREEEQYRFARADLLGSKAPWKLVFLHAPVFNLGGHASHWGHADYLPLFRKAKVDLVLSGHSHIYERFRPLAPKARRPDWAITHVTTGGGGAGLHTVFPHPAVIVSETTNHFMVFEAKADVLEARAIRIDGSELDRFELRKERGRYTRDLLNNSYREEDLAPFFELSPALAPRLTALPSATSPAWAMLTVPPRAKGKSPAEVEISLLSESATGYELLNGPVRTVTPQQGFTNVLWTQVRALPGGTVTTNRSGELTPPLRFQAVVKSRDEEGVAVSALGRISKTAQEAFQQRF